jgi:hypothetical protein
MTISSVAIYIAAFLPWCTAYVLLALMSIKALKGGSKGMHPFAASFGQTCCVMCIVAVPALLLVLISLLGLGGTLIAGWSGVILAGAAWMYEKKKLGYLYLLPGAVAVFLMMAALEFSLPYPDIVPPPLFNTVQQMPLLPFLH